MTQAPEGATLDSILRAGEIDGFIGPRAIRAFDDGHPQVARLFADGITTAADHFKRTQLFPIMHVLGVRKTLADAHPWLPGALLKAFSQAKDMAQTALADTSANKVTMKFVADTLDAASQLLGPQIWTYGLPGNEHVLATFLDYHHRQGLSPRKLEVSELFHPATTEAYAL